MQQRHRLDGQQLVWQLQTWARELGFSQISVSGVDLRDVEPGVQAWLEAGFHGSMAFMAAHGSKRTRPAELVPGTLSVVCARLDYLSPTLGEHWRRDALRRLDQPDQAVVSVYARGRDYHKLIRTRLQRLVDRMREHIGPFGHRVFSDSAPVMEVALATRSGLGWRGKHTLALRRDAGSTFFLGEIYTDLALPPTPAVQDHCGACEACLDACPTGAIVAPYRVDARRCISYLTIEHDGAIPPALRPAIGNRIYGCDDCQLVCPWNKFAQRSPLPDFDPRHGLDRAGLLELWAWDEPTFLARTEGNPLRRIGYPRWRRNLAVALGNAWRAGGEGAVRDALAAALPEADEVVAEHIAWALAQR